MFIVAIRLCPINKRQELYRSFGVFYRDESMANYAKTPTPTPTLTHPFKYTHPHTRTLLLDQQFAH